VTLRLPALSDEETNTFTDGGSTLKAVVWNEAQLTVERPNGSSCKLQT